MNYSEILDSLPMRKIDEWKREDAIYVKTPLALYRVMTGYVRVSNLLESGETVVDDIYGPGEYFGLASFSRVATESNFGFAHTRCQTISWPKAQFALICESQPDLWRGMLDLALRSNESLYRRLAYMHSLDAGGRTLATVVDIAERLGSLDASGNRVVPFHLPHHVIAGMVGTSREIVTHFLTTYRRDGLLRYTRNSFTVTPAAGNRLQQAA